MKKYIINPQTTIKETLTLMDEVATKTIFIEENDKIVGSVSDGDIRRSILKDINLNEKVQKIMNPSPTYVLENTDIEEVKCLMIKNRFEAIPVVNTEKKIVQIYFWNSIFSENKPQYKSLDVPVVIMAGGKGSRLAPFTNVFPKPLIPVGNKTMIETIIDEFLKHEIKKFYISVNYMANIIKAYFGEIKKNYQLEYIDELIPLGTIGCVKQAKDNLKSTFFLINCDILVKEDYSKILSFHKKGNFALTIVASMKHIKISYGVCALNKDGNLHEIIEKPEYNMLVNTGLYVLEPFLLDLIPENTFFNITDLMMEMKRLEIPIGVYPISEKSWIDVGEWDEYKKSIDLIGSNHTK